MTLEPDRDRLWEHLLEFAKRIKLSGTPEELESFRYLQARMTAYGYRTQLLQHDAFISLPGPAQMRVNGQPLTCITHSMSVATGPAGLTAELIHLGTGSASDFDGADTRGKIILVHGVANDAVAARASTAGAVGQVHISPNEFLYEMCVSPIWGSPSRSNRAALPRTAVCTINNRDGADLARRCRNGHPVEITLWTQVDTGWRKTPLLVADLPAPGGTGDEPFVLLSGHHDTWHYGVMDNGTANATMLETARLLAELQQSWRRSLRVCFWSGHSHGRYSGSAWYADEYWNELDRRCVAHVNIDSTGGTGAKVLSQSGVATELGAVAHDVIHAISGQSHEGRPIGRGADQSLLGIGIPSMFGSLSHQPDVPPSLAPLGWWWHTPYDTLEHINADNLVRDTKIIATVLERLVCSKILPLDYARYADALGAELTELQSQLGSKMDISDLILLTAKLRDISVNIAPVGRLCSDAEADRINHGLRAASRWLVPLSYTSGDRFEHDPALPQSSWPVLARLRELAEEPDDSFELEFFQVDARRTRNRVMFHLRQACDVLGEP